MGCIPAPAQGAPVPYGAPGARAHLLAHGLEGFGADRDLAPVGAVHGRDEEDQQAQEAGQDGGQHQVAPRVGQDEQEGQGDARRRPASSTYHTTAGRPVAVAPNARSRRSSR